MIANTNLVSHIYILEGSGVTLFIFNSFHSQCPLSLSPRHSVFTAPANQICSRDNRPMRSQTEIRPGPAAAPAPATAPEGACRREVIITTHGKYRDMGSNRFTGPGPAKNIIKNASGLRSIMRISPSLLQGKKIFWFYQPTCGLFPLSSTVRVKNVVLDKKTHKAQYSETAGEFHKVGKGLSSDGDCKSDETQHRVIWY